MACHDLATTLGFWFTTTTSMTILAWRVWNSLTGFDIRQFSHADTGFHLDHNTVITTHVC
jgi:hypothetical protein